MDLMIEDLMGKLVEDGGSDLHLSAGLPPFGRFKRRTAADDGDTPEGGRLQPADLHDAEQCQRKKLEQNWSWTAPTASRASPASG